MAYDTGARGAPVHKAVVVSVGSESAVVEVTWFPDGTVSRRAVPLGRLTPWTHYHKDAHATLRANAVARRVQDQLARGGRP